MKQKALLLLLLSISLFQANVNANSNDFELRGTNVITEEKSSILESSNLKQSYKNSKKELKKEIKKRKKYHKSLLSLYNESFDNKYLKLIQNNSMKITELSQV